MERYRYRSGQVMLALLVVFASALFAQIPLEPEDPVYGTWVLDLGRSSFRQGPAPKSQLRIYEPYPITGTVRPYIQGLKGTVITVDSRGNETTTTFIGRYDSIQHPYAGREGADAIALERTGPLTAVSKFFHGAIAVGNATRTISADGKELTIRVEFGNKIHSIEVFRKQQ